MDTGSCGSVPHSMTSSWSRTDDRSSAALFDDLRTAKIDRPRTML